MTRSTINRLTLAAMAALAPLGARAQYTDRLVFDGEPGESYCVLFYPRVSGADVALDLTPTAQAGRYELLATAMDEGVLSAATYTGRIYNRTASGLNPTTHADLWVSSLSAFQWDGDSIVTDDERLVLRATADAGAGTIGRALHNLRQFFGSNTNGVASAAGLQNAPTGSGGSTPPVNQIAVPPARTWTPVATDRGLVDETPRTLAVGQSRLFACDFRNDLPTNGRLDDFLSIEIIEGEEGGVEFAETELDPGIDKSLAKNTITGVTAGTYKLRIAASIDGAFGGGSSVAEVTLIVTE